MEDSNGYTRLTSLATKFKNIHLYSLASSTALSLTGIMLRIPTTKKPLMMLICHGGDWEKFVFHNQVFFDVFKYAFVLFANHFFFQSWIHKYNLDALLLCVFLFKKWSHFLSVNSFHAIPEQKYYLILKRIFEGFDWRFWCTWWKSTDAIKWHRAPKSLFSLFFFVNYFQLLFCCQVSGYCCVILNNCKCFPCFNDPTVLISYYDLFFAE